MKLNGILGAYLMMASPMIEAMANREIKIIELRDQYANLQNLPRKKKKHEKKRILKEWETIQYIPTFSF
jgi:hypothetical protein